MKLLAGLVVFVAWLAMALVAFWKSRAGWADNHADLGFWWAVIAALLAIAAIGALVGTLLHMRPQRR